MLTAAFIRALHNASQGINRLATNLTKWVKNRRALRQLDALDEYMLKDIGLTRSDIVAAQAVPWHQDPYIIGPLANKRGIAKPSIKQNVFVSDLQTNAKDEQSCCASLKGAAA
ncbi:MAG: DUF1127 domain-containing protein [Cohaesibacter sp.]|nr:DUF1127 domain-containing protein [Cohaesibacter sp.]